MKMRLLAKLAIVLVGACIAIGAGVVNAAIADDDERALLRTDRGEFGSGISSATRSEELLEPDFSWTDSGGKTRSKFQILKAARSGTDLPKDAASGNELGATASGPSAIQT